MVSVDVKHHVYLLYSVWNCFSEGFFFGGGGGDGGGGVKVLLRFLGEFRTREGGGGGGGEREL